ncbi:hypothetical protein CcI156_05885 [Frankia sp. CcI156]|uniref:hypothetical protein n=1 Tax=unclassified Frankia TaxID=2632575 RepID=UPI0003CFD171|nr:MULTISPECIES: hypothetical protein [unclassified Frankia]ETA01691.1 hypothetical protein CcI6DRAFT_02871 [Frankia sp. CcI6]KFB03867.1 hypothetical protein ALLO2DRAFT_03383 [Frankia sp. Allo2]OHV48524.1 hypothetical protein CgIS1_05805 [Frankia sp. CgIS1]ONH28239.1 hypothetical protein CcI156_05885 [Frankia sp. CcI156]
MSRGRGRPRRPEEIVWSADSDGNPQHLSGSGSSELTYGGDTAFDAPVHGSDAAGNEVTVSFGRDGTSAEGETLIADGHVSSKEFYGKDDDGVKGHDHSHPSDPRHGGYEDRGRYSG